MRILCFLFGLMILLGSCTERVICPAYQSAFMHDKEALTAHFSYFNADSTPKVRDVEKSRYLIVEPVAYKKRVREMRTIVMQDIYPVPDDSVGFDQDLMLAERDVIDSATMASAKDSIHPGLKGPFNTDQQLYMYYLEDILLLPDMRAQMDLKYERNRKGKKKKEEEEPKEEEEVKEKKGPFSIFKKKNKKENESEEDQAPNEEDQDSPPDEQPTEDNNEGEDDF